jgi:hypothetical protein
MLSKAYFAHTVQVCVSFDSKNKQKNYAISYYQTEYSNGDLSLCWTELIYYESACCLGLNSTDTDIVQYNINVMGLIL